MNVKRRTKITNLCRNYFNELKWREKLWIINYIGEKVPWQFEYYIRVWWIGYYKNYLIRSSRNCMNYPRKKYHSYSPPSAYSPFKRNTIQFFVRMITKLRMYNNNNNRWTLKTFQVNPTNPIIKHDNIKNSMKTIEIEYDFAVCCWQNMNSLEQTIKYNQLQ